MNKLLNFCTTSACKPCGTTVLFEDKAGELLDKLNHHSDKLEAMIGTKDCVEYEQNMHKLEAMIHQEAENKIKEIEKQKQQQLDAHKKLMERK